MSAVSSVPRPTYVANLSVVEDLARASTTLATARDTLAVGRSSERAVQGVLAARDMLSAAGHDAATLRGDGAYLLGADLAAQVRDIDGHLDAALPHLVDVAPLTADRVQLAGGPITDALAGATRAALLHGRILAAYSGT